MSARCYKQKQKEKENEEERKKEIIKRIREMEKINYKLEKRKNAN